MPQWAISFEYNGQDFHGSQTQANVRTVQSVLESALSKVANEPIKTTFAGRTDTGVHATNQVASFRTNAIRHADAWVFGTNSHLPQDVAVHSANEVPAEFNARRSALRRRYLYVIGQCTHIPVFGRWEAYWVKYPIETTPLDGLADIFLGEHDFSAFCAAGDESESRFRDIQRFDVKRHGPFVILDITANAFLLRMVRNIAGCLLAVAQGIISLQDVAKILTDRDRTLAPPTAPAEGLYLVHIEYDELKDENTLRVPSILGPDSQGLFTNDSLPQVTYVRPNQDATLVKLT